MEKEEQIRKWNAMFKESFYILNTTFACFEVRKNILVQWFIILFIFIIFTLSHYFYLNILFILVHRPFHHRPISCFINLYLFSNWVAIVFVTNFDFLELMIQKKFFFGNASSIQLLYKFITIFFLHFPAFFTSIILSINIYIYTYA